MDAIDWPALARGILWVFGLSVSLAALSHVRWTAKRAGVPLRNVIGWDSFLVPFFTGLVLFAMAQAWGARQLWETVAWAVLDVLFAWQVILAVRSERRARRTPGQSAKEERAHEASQ